VGDRDLEAEKEQSMIEEKAYRDTWGRGLDSYLHMMYDRLMLMRELLSDTGSIYVHVGPNMSHYVRVLLDQIFGLDNYLNDIVWQRFSFHADAKRFGIVHDSILYYAKGRTWAWNVQRAPLKDSYIASHFRNTDKDGRRFKMADALGKGQGPARRFGDRTIEPPPGTHWRWSQERIDELMAAGKIGFTRTGMPAMKIYLDEVEGAAIHSIWTDVYPVNPQADERLGFETQKPEALLERIIRASSNEGDLVADFFCGSGTTMAVAEKMGRRWVGCDLSRWAMHLSRKRLLGMEGCKAFEVLNLGKYERRYWQGVTFGNRKKDDQQVAIFQYIAFILRLYDAEPLAGMQHLHGKKGKAVVHAGAVDAPVTIDEINACIEECLAVRQSELHVLGWEWEMGLANLMVQEAKRRGTKLLLLNIPREVMEQQAVEKGDIRFFEVGHLEVEIKQEKGRKVTVGLKDFAFPYADLIPKDVRSKIKKWSDYLDYWAVDWNFQNDTFMNGWVAYRTRKERTLALKTDPYAYDKAGKYTVMVKVVDIFGNDTSQAFEVEVK
jgi:DNA modification methylase